MRESPCERSLPVLDYSCWFQLRSSRGHSASPGPVGPVQLPKCGVSSGGVTIPRFSDGEFLVCSAFYIPLHCLCNSFVAGD